LLADRVEALLKGDQSRVAIKAEAARKKKASKLKKTRRKYRELEGKEGDAEGREGDADGNGKVMVEEEIPEGEGEVRVQGKEEKEVDVETRIVEESKRSGKGV
jgi:hypothetical protein